MAHGRFDDHCGCFPTGQSWPGIAGLMLARPAAPIAGLASEFEPGESLVDLGLAVIDTETTGRDPARGDRVIEIAIVCFDNGVVTARHAMLFDPQMPIPAEATAVHHITDADVKGKPRFEAKADEIARLLGGRLPVAYNADFDRGFIYAEMRRAGVTPGPEIALPPALRTTVEWIDPLVWARALQPGEKGYKLGDVAARMNVAMDRAHRATDDAEAAGMVMLGLPGLRDLPYGDVVKKQREHQKNWEKTRGRWR